MASHREEATKAIDHVIGMLARDLDPLNRRIALATLEHAKEQVAAIQEVKRRRKEPEPA
jgi:hypothetical protein